MYPKALRSFLTTVARMFAIIGWSAAPCLGELYSLRLPGLETLYGGIFGDTIHHAPFDFEQHFIAIDQAWLHVEATTDDLAHPNYISYAANVNGPWWEGGGGEAFLDPWETLVVDIALPTGPGMLHGWGYVELLILTGYGEDRVSVVTEATLWFDATPVPEPAGLALLGLGALALRRRRR